MAAAGAGKWVLAVRVRVAAARGRSRVGTWPSSCQPRSLGRATHGTWVGETPGSRPRPCGPAPAWSRVKRELRVPAAPQSSLGRNGSAELAAVPSGAERRTPSGFRIWAKALAAPVVRVLRESRSRDTPTAACRVPTREEHLAECATSVSPAGGRVCTAVSSGGSFAALHASRLLLQHLWAAADAVFSTLSALGAGRLWVRLRRLSAPPTPQIPTSSSTV